MNCSNQRPGNDKMIVCKKAYHKKYYSKNREQILAQQKRYRTENAEILKSRHKSWYENNRERLTSSQRAYCQQNKEHIRNYGRQYCKNNRENINEYWRSYYAKNKEQIRQRLRDQKQRALSIWVEKSVFPVGNQMEQAFPLKIFRKKGNTFRGIPLFSFSPELPENHCTIYFITLVLCSSVKYTISLEKMASSFMFQCPTCGYHFEQAKFLFLRQR